MSLSFKKEWTTAASQVLRMNCENITPNNYFYKSTTASLSRLEEDSPDHKQVNGGRKYSFGFFPESEGGTNQCNKPICLSISSSVICQMQWKKSKETQSIKTYTVLLQI